MTVSINFSRSIKPAVFFQLLIHLLEPTALFRRYLTSLEVKVDERHYQLIHIFFLSDQILNMKNKAAFSCTNFNGTSWAKKMAILFNNFKGTAKKRFENTGISVWKKLRIFFAGYLFLRDHSFSYVLQLFSFTFSYNFVITY